MLRYKFSSLNFISPLTKNTHMSPHIILSPHKYFPYITQIFSMIMGSHKYFLYKAHKFPWTLSQILLVISHISSNLNSPQINTHHITTKIGPQNYIIPTQGPTSFNLWAKPKESPKPPKVPLRCGQFKSPTTMWLIPKSHYDVANSKVPLRCG